MQVKYGRSDGSTLEIWTRSNSLTTGKVKAIKRYTAELVDWLAVWDARTDRCFYIPAAELGEGMNCLTLRVGPTRNNQVRRVRWAQAYESV
ncbi:MAG: group I intron-associated PD-(D/E)XK endonuclease [Thermoleophilaceae bacterium]